MPRTPINDDDGHPLAVARDDNGRYLPGNPHGPGAPRGRTRKGSAAWLEAEVLRLSTSDDLDVVVANSSTSHAVRARVSTSAQSEAGGRSGANRAAVRALVSAYYADDDGRRLFELLDAAHAKAITPGGQRDRQELLRQLAGAPDTSAPEPEGDDVRKGRSLRGEMRAALKGGAGAFLRALEGDAGAS